MSAIATAVIGSAVIGAVASNNAAGKASDAASKGIDSTNALASQARTDAINLFQQSKTSAQNGINSALNFYQNNAQAKINPYVQGNMAAQQVLGQGATQANNAILGLPVDMSFANTPKQISADYSGITGAKLPTLGASPLATTDAAAQVAGQGNASGIKTLPVGSTGTATGGNRLSTIGTVPSTGNRLAFRGI